MSLKIEIRTVPRDFTEIAAEYDPNACGMDDYDTGRASALYAALGASPSDDEYQLAASRDGRWALIGLTVQGYKYAVEVPEPK